MRRPVEVGDERGLDVDAPVVLGDGPRQVERQSESNEISGLAGHVDPGLDSAESVGMDRGDARAKLRWNVDGEEQQEGQCVHSVRYAHSRLKGTVLKKTLPPSCTRRMSLGLTPMPRSES